MSEKYQTNSGEIIELSNINIELTNSEANDLGRILQATAEDIRQAMLRLPEESRQPYRDQIEKIRDLIGKIPAQSIVLKPGETITNLE